MNNGKIVVSCPVKNDNEYLLEYTEHYLNLGFDKIYFYDNNDENTVQPIELLKPYIKEKKVEVIDYRNRTFHDVVHRKDFFFNHDFEWVLFVDDDEFLELPKHGYIKDFLTAFDADVTKIALNNLHYGDNEHCYYEEGWVQDRFPVPLPLDAGTPNFKFNCAVKSLLKKVDLDAKYLRAHVLCDENPYYNADQKEVKIIKNWRIDEKEVTYDTAFIKHYCTKSLEEFVRCKIKRARNNNNIHKNRFSLDSYYYMYNQRTIQKDELFNVFIECYL